MVCAVLESPQWKEVDTTHIKLKFHFPYCKTDKKFANGIFRNKLIQKLRHSKLNNYFTKSTPIGDWDTHLQEVKDSYPLYGSTDNTKRPPLYYLVTYKENGVEVNLGDVYQYTSHQYITNGKCIEDHIEELDDEDLSDEEKNIYLLPLFLTLDFCSGITQVKEEYNSGKKAASSSVGYSEEDTEHFDENPSNFDICLELIEMLSDKRFKMEPYFLDVGRALYHSTDGDEYGLAEWWKLVERKKLKYEEEWCELKYYNFDTDEITVKTLAWYAREDDLESYQQWHERWCRPKLQQALNAKHIIVAEAFYRVFWLDYMFTGKRWVEFRRSKLHILSEDYGVRRAVTEKFIPCFDRLRAQISEEKLRMNKIAGRNKSSRDKLQELEKLMTDIGKLIDKLHMENYRSSLVRSLKEYFFKENLTRILNKNPSLLGCSNCVIELTDSEAFTRGGKPEDYITKRVGVNYKSTYSFSHPDVISLLRYFEQVFPERSINHHMKKDLASMLYGRNAEKCFRMWIGDTNGSKSVYQKMIRNMLGDYYCDLPATYFSAQQRGGSGPNPELAQTEGSRVAFSAEPDDDTSFKGARIKRLTGGDSFYARACNEDGGTIETTFKTVMVLNIVPDITGMDEATKNRFCMIPFEGRWIRKGENFAVPKTHEEQVKAKTYWMDERFEDNIPKLAGALLWLAVHYYKTYRREGLTAPKYIQDWMTAYWTKHDPHISFITEMLENPKVKEKCEVCSGEGTGCKECKEVGYLEKIDMKRYVTATDVYPVYKKWFRETYPQVPVVPKPRMIEILSTPDKLRKQQDRRWYGVIIRRENPPEIGEL